MGHSGNDAVYKRHHEMKMQLAESMFEKFGIGLLYI